MIFNSIGFAIFFSVVFCAYWFVFSKSYRAQNILLLIASYFFYGCWDWRFLFLLAFSTFLDYYIGLKLEDSQSQKKRKFLLVLSVVVNLGFLGFFKYFNFFISSFADVIQVFGFNPHLPTLSVILPVGISFYTFHGLSYVFDIYNRKITANKNWIDYTVFVSFFPLLVAGPIERATHLLPQVMAPRVIDRSKFSDGMRQILWGLFKKMVIADNCAQYANLIFEHPQDYGGSTLVLGALFFAFQIYGDFSGYSDIALGTARLLGFELLQNFKYPYFSRDIAEFWRRWHVSLSSWFRDYLYIPLGGSRGNLLMKIRNTFIIFIVSGFWHGANWTFLVWGLLHAIYFLPLLITSKNRVHLDIIAQDKWFPSLKDFTKMVFTFGLTTFAWIFFRAESITAALSYIDGIASVSLFSIPDVLPIYLFILILFFVVVEWTGRSHPYPIATLGWKWPRPVRWAFYYLVILAIFYFEGEYQQFIYFQF